MGKVTEVLAFGPEASDQISFSLETYDQEDLAVTFQTHTITIKVPQALAKQWVQTDLVGFNGKIDTGKERVIKILVEKDFMCIDGSDEDNEGAYPNPMTTC
jgi:hypothetical protein